MDIGCQEQLASSAAYSISSTGLINCRQGFGSGRYLTSMFTEISEMNN